MATSQNGWPVDYDGSEQDRRPLIRDVKVPNGVLEGDVYTVMCWLARQYDARVEMLVAGACWGWLVKEISGSDDYSNHASGTAVDFNADKHNMGDPPSESMSPHMIDQCHAIERESDGVLSWGGDWSRPDPMHWEIKGTREQVAAFARKIEQGGDMDRSIFKLGDTGEAGKFWQRRLKRTGFDPGEIDGEYGPKTEAAVNASRKFYDSNQGPHVEITGWHADQIEQHLFG